MKKVVLLGDSLRLIGYGTVLPQLLGENYTVFQPQENGRFALYTYQSLALYENEIRGADIVHFNNGNWDVDTMPDGKPLVSRELYAETVVRTAKVLMQWAKRVIFATTIPVRSGYTLSDNARIADYNAAAVAALQKIGVEIDDLYAFVLPHLNEYIRGDDNIHLNEAGIRAVADAVADVIRK